MIPFPGALKSIFFANTKGDFIFDFSQKFLCHKYIAIYFEALTEMQKNLKT